MTTYALLVNADDCTLLPDLENLEHRPAAWRGSTRCRLVEGLEVTVKGGIVSNAGLALLRQLVGKTGQS
jgi:hypothetical protein